MAIIISDEEILAKVKNAISYASLCDDDKINPSSSLVKDLGLDSLDRTGVVHDIAHEVHFTEEEAYRIEDFLPMMDLEVLKHCDRREGELIIGKQTVEYMESVFPLIENPEQYIGQVAGDAFADIETVDYLCKVVRYVADTV